jgi:hypothetical protein
MPAPIVQEEQLHKQMAQLSQPSRQREASLSGGDVVAPNPPVSEVHTSNEDAASIVEGLGALKLGSTEHGCCKYIHIKKLLSRIENNANISIKLARMKLSDM